MLIFPQPAPSLVMKTSLLLLLATSATLLADAPTEIPSRTSYAGVIRNAASDDHAHAGFFAARLGASGAFSARVSWQGFGYALGGALSSTGTFDGTLPKVGGGTFTVHLDAAAVPGKIVVAVTDGAITSGVDARPALYGHGTPSPWNAKFNGVANHFPDLGFLPNTDGLVRVSRDGSVRYIARLGDGTIYTAGSFLVADDATTFPDGTVRVVGDKFPLYTGLYHPATRGSVWGDGTVLDLTLIPNYTSPFSQAADGALQWHRPAQPNGPQPNTAGQAAVYPFFSEFSAPAPGEPVVPLALPPLPPGYLSFDGGDLAGFIRVDLSWNPVQQFVPAPNPYEVRLFSNAREGTFVGTFRHPGTQRVVFFSGVYRPLSGGVGAFMGPDHVGSVFLIGLD